MLDNTVDLEKVKLSRWALFSYMSPLSLDLEIRDRERQRFKIAETFILLALKKQLPSFGESDIAENGRKPLGAENDPLDKTSRK